MANRMVALFIILFSCVHLSAAEASSQEEPIKIEFTGLNKLSESQLRSSAHTELKGFAIHKRESFLFDASYSMLQYMRNKGYYFSKVSYTYIPNKQNPTQILFTVSERNPVVIDKIEITGAKAWETWNEEDITMTIGSPIKGLLKHFGVGKLVFRKTDVDNAINSIMTAYLLHGYQNVLVGPAELKWNKDKTKVSIYIPVKEGPQFTFGEIDITHNTEDCNIKKSKLDAIIDEIKLKNKPFHPRLLRQEIGSIRRKLNDFGYLAAMVDGSYTFTNNSLVVNAKIFIKPGPQYIFDELVIAGNPYTRKGIFNFYTRRLKKGRSINYNRIEESIGYLYRIGIFESLKWDKVVKANNGDGTVTADIIINVKELPKRNLDFSLGYGSYEQFRGGITYHNKNLFGIGLDGEIDYSLSMKSQRIEGSLFMGEYYRKQFLILQSSWEDREEPSFDSEVYDIQLRYRTLYGDKKMCGIDFYGLFGLDLKDKIEGLLGYNFERSKATNIVPGAQIGEGETFLVSSIEFAQTLELRDDLFNPTRGLRMRGDVEWATPSLGSDLEFFRYEGHIQYYIPFGEEPDWVLATNLRLNTYDLKHDTKELPIQKRLFLGGENSVRSFKRHELGPTNKNGDPIGGLSSLLASVEARFPLFPDYNLSGALFWDGGIIDEDEHEFNGDMGQSIGLGIRFDLPIGPIRLDVAQHIGEEFATDEDVAVHFSLGFSF